MRLNKNVLRALRRATAGLRDAEIKSNHPLRSIKNRLLLIWSVPPVLVVAAVVTTAFESPTVFPVALVGSATLFLLGIWSPPRVVPPGASSFAVAVLYLGAAVDFAALLLLGGVFIMMLSHAT